MKKDLGVKPYLFPMPVLMIATYGDNDTVDVMNMAWAESAQKTWFPSILVKAIKHPKISKNAVHLHSVSQTFPT